MQLRLIERLRALGPREILRLVRRIPAVIRLAASLASIAGVYITIAAIFGIWPSNNGSTDNVDSIVLSPTPTLDPDRPELPDFLLSDVYLCQLVFPSPENSPPPQDPASILSVLSLSFKILNKGNLDFKPNEVFLRAVSGLGLEAEMHTFLDKDSWNFDPALRERAAEDHIDLPLTSTDFGQEHRIVISVDSTGIGSGSQVAEADEFNNDTVVLVDLPQAAPTEDWTTVPCSPESISTTAN